MSLLANIGGGVGAAILDRQFPDKNFTIPGLNVTLSAGTLATGAALALLAFGGSKVPARGILASLAGGALVYEGTQLGQLQVLPLVDRYFPGSAPAAALPAGDAIQGEDWASNPAGNFGLDESLCAFRCLY